MYPQSSYADREAPEREHSQRDRYVLFPQPLSARVPFCLLHVRPSRQCRNSTRWLKKYYQIENPLVYQYPASVAPAQLGYSSATLFPSSRRPVVQVPPLTYSAPRYSSLINSLKSNILHNSSLDKEVCMSYIFLCDVLYERGVQELKNHCQASTCQS